MTVRIQRLSGGDTEVLLNVAPEVFDGEIDPRWTAEFLEDPRHHLVVALDDDCVIGFVSGVHYVHPDKPPEMWINEIAVAPTYRDRGIGKDLLTALLEHAHTLGCREAWVLTERQNRSAMGLYRSLDGDRAPSDAAMFTFRLDSDAP